MHRARGELDSAIAVLQKGSRIKPQRSDILYHLGIVYSEKGGKPQAIAAFEKALTIDRNFPEAADAQRRLTAIR